MTLDIGTTTVVGIAVVLAIVILGLMIILSRRGRTKAPESSAHEHKECLACGWSGQVSKFHRKCPNCGDTIT
ncbi:MAG: hypothetical protein HY914_13695 [Desulfomonile tiedjei]|nr:hypothetical protein [Desulfomonile tiedjei]